MRRPLRLAILAALGAVLGGLLLWTQPLWGLPQSSLIWPLAGLLAGLALAPVRPPRPPTGLAWLWWPPLYGLGFLALLAVLGLLGVRLADALSNWLSPTSSRTVDVVIASGGMDAGQIAAGLALLWLVGLPFALVQPRRERRA